MKRPGCSAACASLLALAGCDRLEDQQAADAAAFEAEAKAAAERVDLSLASLATCQTLASNAALKYQTYGAYAESLVDKGEARLGPDGVVYEWDRVAALWSPLTPQPNPEGVARMQAEEERLHMAAAVEALWFERMYGDDIAREHGAEFAAGMAVGHHEATAAGEIELAPYLESRGADGAATSDIFRGMPGLVADGWTNEAAFNKRNCGLLGYASAGPQVAPGWTPVGASVVADAHDAGAPTDEQERDAQAVSNLVSAAARCTAFADSAGLADERARLLRVAHEGAVVVIPLAVRAAAAAGDEDFPAVVELYGLEFLAGLGVGSEAGEAFNYDWAQRVRLGMGEPVQKVDPAEAFSRDNCTLLGHEARPAAPEGATPLGAVPLE